MALLAEIQATCSSLGYLENDEYIREPDCLESIKDLIRYLKREDDTCDIRRLLGEAQIVQNDLIPLLKSVVNDSILLDTAVRLLVNLTQPALICFQGYIPTEKTQYNYYLEVLGHLDAYKQAFADQRLFQGLCQKLGDLLQLDWENRQEEDRLLIERILILIRNVLHISPLEDERRTDDDASVHDQVVWAIHTSGMEDLLLYIASSNDERQFAIHVLEIVSLLFREQSADQLARAGAGRTMTEKEKDEQELLQSRLREKVAKRLASAKYSTRHSRFGGTYVLPSVKSISDNAMIYHRSQGDVKNISFDQGKRPKKLGKNRKPIMEDGTTRRSTLSIRLALKHLCIQFIENCYNPLMNCVKDRLQHSQTDEHDETYYMWALRFFMEFQRHYRFRVDVISETLNSASFHYIHVQIMNYNDMMHTNKNEATTWGKRMHLALKAYKELLLSMHAMEKSTSTIRESAKVLKSNIFYVPEYKDLLLMLLMKFRQNRQSRGYLKDLVETVHVFLKMLEEYSTGKNLMVLSKKRKKHKKKRRPVVPEAPNLDEIWSEISSDLSALIQGREEVPEVIAPFDAAAEVPIDEQRDQAMMKIHQALRSKQAGEAVALLRAARQVWPDDGIFGEEGISNEDEFMAMRQIFNTELDSQVEPPAQEEEEDSESEDEREEFISSEQKFEFRDYVMKFVKPDILKPYVLLLSEYDKNTPAMNHYLVKMLHRVSVDCKVPGMLFQLSLFRVFQKLLQDHTARVAHKELVKFAHFIIMKFLNVDSKDKFHELLFWKNVRESLELIDGFGTFREEKAKSSSWTEEEEMELTRLYEEFKEHDDPELDVVDLIMRDIINKNRTRRQIIAKLSHLDLINNAKDIKKKKKPNRAKVWLEEDELELKTLFEEHKGKADILNLILSNLSIKRSKNAVIEKMLAMDLISDRKEVYIRRKKKKPEEDLENPPKSKEFISSDENSESESETKVNQSSDSESENETTKRRGNHSSDDDDDAFLKFINKNKVDQTPKGNIDTHVKKLIEDGLEDDLNWILTIFEDETADREEEKPDDATPIVPLTPSNSAALNNSSFKALLKLLGARPPVNEQERYWRIPEYFTPGMLLERVGNVKKSRENAKTSEEDKENQIAPKKRQISESSDDDPLRLILDDTQESDDGKSPLKKRSRLGSENDSNAAIGKRSIVDDSDDSLDLPRKSKAPESPLSEKSTNIPPNTESPFSKRSTGKNTLNSDSESDVEDRIPLRKVVRRPMIDSDSD